MARKLYQICTITRQTIFCRYKTKDFTLTSTDDFTNPWNQDIHIQPDPIADRMAKYPVTKICEDSVVRGSVAKVEASFEVKTLDEDTLRGEEREQIVFGFARKDWNRQVYILLKSKTSPLKVTKDG